ncbi:MAG TPA: hypothetical protein VK634_09520 [Reyranella sp.]|nr:hypothetical protein [Reyranella sp.]
MSVPAAVSPPPGTGQRIRARAIWAVAFFTAAVPPAIVGFGIVAGGTELAGIGPLFAFGFWLIGLVMAFWAAIPTLRYWDGLPGPTRWLGALPLISVSLFLSFALLAAAFD